MRIILKFIAALVIGFIIAGSERPIHRLEKTIAGNEGVSRWYLIMRYIIGTGALTVSQMVMLWRDEHIELVKRDMIKAQSDFTNGVIGEAEYSGRIGEHNASIVERVAMAMLIGAVGVGSGVGLRWVFESWEDLSE